MLKPKWSSLAICSGVNKVFSQRELQHTGYFLFFTTFSIKPKFGCLQKIHRAVFKVALITFIPYLWRWDIILLSWSWRAAQVYATKWLVWRSQAYFLKQENIVKTMHPCSIWMSVFFTDLSSPEAPVCWGAPAGPVPRSACHVCVSALAAPHAEPGGADWALWRDSLQNCAAGGNLHREIQRQEARGKQDPVRAVGVGWDIFCSVLWFIMSL